MNCQTSQWCCEASKAVRCRTDVGATTALISFSVFYWSKSMKTLLATAVATVSLLTSGVYKLSTDLQYPSLSAIYGSLFDLC